MHNLHDILTVLASPSADLEDRRNAESSLAEALGFLRTWLKRKFPDEPSEHIQLAIDHVKDRSTVGTSRYRGEKRERSAIAWCQAIARNRMISLWRHERTHERKQREIAAQQVFEAARAEEDARRMQLAQRVVTLAQGFVEGIERDPDVAAGRFKRMRLGLEVLFTPITQEQQLISYGYVREGETDPVVLKKANDLLYQHRRRGRVDLVKVVAKLVAIRKLDEDEAIEFAAVARLPWPPPQRDKADALYA